MKQKTSFIQRLIDRITPASVTTYTRNEQLPPKQSVDLARFMAAVAANETGIVQGDPYRFAKQSGVKALGRDLGKYQVTEGELKTYGPRYLGQPISGNEFLASTTAQDKYIQNKAKYYADRGYTAQQIADIHRRGYKKSSPAGSTEYQDPEYVNKFNTIYNATTTPQ